MTQFQVIVRKGKSTAFGRKLAPLEGAEVGGLFICATGPDEYWVMAVKQGASDVETRLLKQFGETASLFDQSHGRAVLRIEGPCAADVLAKAHGGEILIASIISNVQKRPEGREYTYKRRDHHSE